MKPVGDLTSYWDPENSHFDTNTGRRGDVIFSTTDGPHAINGRRLLYHAFSCVKMGDKPEDKSFLDELEDRGFDITTIRFSIDRKQASAKETT